MFCRYQLTFLDFLLNLWPRYQPKRQGRIKTEAAFPEKLLHCCCRK